MNNKNLIILLAFFSTVCCYGMNNIKLNNQLIELFGNESKLSYKKSMNHKECVTFQVQLETLLKAGADPNVKLVARGLFHVFSYPVIKASEWNCKNLVEVLLENGANPNIMPGYAGFNALYYACKNKNEDLIEVLLENGADPNLPFSEDFSNYVLFHVCREGYTRGVELLLKYGADPNKIDEIEEETTSLFEFPKKEILQLLLKHGANLAVVDNNGDTCLHRACSKMTPISVEFVKNIIEICKNEEMFLFALKEKKLKVPVPLKKIIFDEAKTINIKKILNMKNKQKQTCLDILCEKTDPPFDLILLLLKNGAQLEEKLIEKYKKENQELFYFLYKKSKDKKYFNTLIFKELVNLDTLKSFLKNGGDLNGKDEDERTILHLLCSKPIKDNDETKKCIEWLINNGADLALKDKNGNTAQEYLFFHNKKIFENKDSDIMKLFSQKSSLEIVNQLLMSLKNKLKQLLSTIQALAVEK